MLTKGVHLALRQVPGTAVHLTLMSLAAGVPLRPEEMSEDLESARF